MSRPVDQRPGVPRLVGAGLLVSILFWWQGLYGWATAKFGYVEVDAIGSTPYLWTLYIAATGVLLLSGILPRRGAEAPAAVVFVMGAAALAIPDLAANTDDGISAAGWLLAGASVAQVLAVLFALLGRGRTRTR